MSDTVIRVEGLGKKFKISSQQPYHRFSEVVSGFGSQLAKAPARLFRKQRHTAEELAEKRSNEFWALKDINFEVKEGDVVGIIGRNGAGKSTLLKILSRITEPTEGRFGLKGRVASLLEVGTGFHPELTGRENIFLSGSVLGMSRAEIKRKFDEIVDFAGVEQFLDTPVKRYSSGMQVRLGFAVAAHLEPEILIVDEVLAVGDAEFQKKCLGKMNDVAESGRTILFVSHNLAAVRGLCRTSFLLESGRIAAVGGSGDVSEIYLAKNARSAGLDVLREKCAQLPIDELFELRSLSISQLGSETLALSPSEPIDIRFDYDLRHKQHGFRVYVDITDEYDTLLIRTFHDEQNSAVGSMEAGFYSSKARIPPNLLAPRRYRVYFRATIHGVRTCLPADFGLTVEVSRGEINRAYPHEPIRSLLQPAIEWNTTSRTVASEYV